MAGYFKLFLLSVVFCFAALHGDDDDAPWDPDVIRHVHPNQNADMLMGCIPPEFQNLPYAIYPTDPEYNTARLNFNKRFNYFPKAIIAPTTYQEAQFVVSILKKYRLEFSVRSGGHCFEPGSLSSDFIIDISNFNQIIPDVPNQQVFLGAGCVIGTVIDTLGQLDFAIPTGTCPTVAIGGLTLGGGIGFLSRPFGLTCGSVRSITFLTADAEIIEVDEANYPDLFWALLGGGNGSYGIALGFTFQMYFIPEASFYELTWEMDPKLIPCIMHAWQKFVQAIPTNVTSVLGINHTNERCAMPELTPPFVISVSGLKIGPEPFTEWIKFFEHLHPTVRIFTGSYLDLAKFWATEEKLPFNKSKSRILFKPVSNKVIKQVTQFFTKLEKADPEFVVSFDFEVFGGKVAENKTSFFPSKAFGWWQQTYFWDRQVQTEGILALSRKFYANIPKEVSKFCYANIVDYDLGRKYLKRYYGDHVCRLIQVKDKFDPTNLFHWHQSIPTSKERMKEEG